MLLDGNIIGFGRGFVAGIAWEWAGVKNTRVCIVPNISENLKNFKISRSKIFLQDEHLLCHRIAHSVRPANTLISIGFSIVSHGVRFGCFFRQIVLISQKKIDLEILKILKFSEML